MFLIAEIVGHLAFERTLHEPLLQLIDQPVLVEDIFGKRVLEDMIHESAEFLLSLGLPFFRAIGSLMVRSLTHGQLHRNQYSPIVPP